MFFKNIVKNLLAIELVVIDELGIVVVVLSRSHRRFVNYTTSEKRSRNMPCTY